MKCAYCSTETPIISSQVCSKCCKDICNTCAGIFMSSLVDEDDNMCIKCAEKAMITRFPATVRIERGAAGGRDKRPRVDSEDSTDVSKFAMDWTNTERWVVAVVGGYTIRIDLLNDITVVHHHHHWSEVRLDDGISILVLAMPHHHLARYVYQRLCTLRDLYEKGSTPANEGTV